MRMLDLVAMAVQSWATILVCGVLGAVGVHGSNTVEPWHPAGVAAFFTFQALVRSRSEDVTWQGAVTLGSSKLIFAYLAFTVGAIAGSVSR